MGRADSAVTVPHLAALRRLRPPRDGTGSPLPRNRLRDRRLWRCEGRRCSVARDATRPPGKVTQGREITGDGVGSFVDAYTQRMPVDVIDSDTAVGLGKAALASRFDPARTRDPRRSIR